MARFSTLNEWLVWLEQLHPKAIDLGLQRVYSVAYKLKLLKSPSSISHEFSGGFNTKRATSHSTAINPKVITVAGTNGKGSFVSVIEQGVLENSVGRQLENSNAMNHLVGSYTSPHLHHFCERIRIDNEPVSEALVCAAFTAIDDARGDISLTYFEFGTLAALWVFSELNIPLVVLEVGLGGRLDAVNIVDADIAVVTSIDVDHEEWLGSDRNIISQEKLGVARDGRSLVIAETNLTEALAAAAQTDNSLLIGRDFSIDASECGSQGSDSVQDRQSEQKPEKQFTEAHVIIDRNGDASDAVALGQSQWQFKYKGLSQILPLPSLPLPSVASALIVLDMLNIMPAREKLSGLMNGLSLPGRFQKTVVNDKCVIYDVAHNPAAAIALAKRLAQEPIEAKAKTFAVMAMMSDKDHDTIFSSLSKVFDHWYIGDLSSIPRAARAEDLSAILRQNQCAVTIESTIENAFNKASSIACGHDRIVVFGSFYTVAAIQSLVNY